jgi:hypothetical protein
MSRELTKEIITVTAGEKPFRYLQESHSDNIICKTNSINQQFHDELEKWRRKNGPMKDVNKEFKDLLKDMSHEQDESLTKEKSIIKLKRNYPQKREIRETVTYTAEENEVSEPDTAKELSVNKIHELLENVQLKVEESNCNLDSVQVPEDVSSSEITENVIYAQNRKTEDFSAKHTVQGKLKILHKSVKIVCEITSSNSYSFSPKNNECTLVINPIPKERGIEMTIDKLMI